MIQNGGAPHYFTTQIDVANGFPTENPFLRRTQQSKFIESAYVHNIGGNTSEDVMSTTSEGENPTLRYITQNPTYAGTGVTNNNSHLMGKSHGHYVHTGLMNESTSDSFTVADSTLPRVEPAVASTYWASKKHIISRKVKFGLSEPLIEQMKGIRTSLGSNYTTRDASTMMDTPDGTRAISAFLCLKGIRSQSLLLSTHEEGRLQHLDHWSKMDFVRRLTIDFGEVGIKEGVTDIQAAAKEIVRLINQGGAKNALTTGSTDTGSIYDPAPWWFANEAFASQNRGSHMGYLRAHLGRVVEDLNGNTGFSVIVHSTVPGASGRNFCTWLDNSKGQSQYQPKFLIGHGGRFRNFWCQPDETSGENMHPAPMPINKHGRPFAPITTLREYVSQEETDDAFQSNGDFTLRKNYLSNATKRSISASNGSGMIANTINDESFESQSESKTLVEGLRTGTNAFGRVNFGGLVAAGIPGFAPDAGIWGLGENGNAVFDTRYSNAVKTNDTNVTPIDSYSDHVTNSQVVNVGDGQLYGFQFEDHRGNNYGVRYIYRNMGTNFSNEETTLPKTLDNEICVYFDDRDVGQGGFTIGNHMLGFGDVTGRIDTTGTRMTEASYRGNRWNGVPAPSVGIDASVTYTTGKMTVVLHPPFDSVQVLPADCNANTAVTLTSTATLFVGMSVSSPVQGGGPPAGTTISSINANGTDLVMSAPSGSVIVSAQGGELIFGGIGSEILGNHPDVLGYLGFPKTNGLLQLNDTFTGATAKGSVGNTFAYTHRTRNGVGTEDAHIFYGVTGNEFTSSHYVANTAVATEIHDAARVQPHASNNSMRVLLSPRINWTTLVTDELMAAVTAAAINHENPSSTLIFDCRKMYAADGRTYGQWGVAADAIKIRAHNPSRMTMPLSRMFEATLHKDWGIQAAHIEYGEYTKFEETSVGLSVTTTDTINKPYSDAEIDAHRRMDVGYLPYTIMQVQSKGRGFNANTATPVLVDSGNNIVPVNTWRRNLKGVNFTSFYWRPYFTFVEQSNTFV